MDLSVEIAGVRFKNPVLPGASELALDGESAVNLIQAGVGGIVTKSFTSRDELRIRVRPYQFPLRVFGRGFEQSGSLCSLSAPHVEDIGQVTRRRIPQMAGVCQREGVPLVVSFYETFDRPGSWVATAGKFEEAGADMLELNFSSPSYSASAGDFARVSGEIIEAVAKGVGIPVGPKISPAIEPLSHLAKIWSDAGASFITAHNAPSGIMVDVENEVPYGAPAVGGYVMGRTFLPWSLARVIQIKRTVDMPVIGTGGILDWSDAIRYILCGCQAVQICSDAYLSGLGVFERIRTGVVAWMERKGYASIEDFRGKVLSSVISSGVLKSRERFAFALPPHAPYIPLIDDEKCTLCLACERSCIYRVFKKVKESRKLAVRDERCWSCGFCVGICPERAISLVDRKDRNRVIWAGEGMARSFIS